MKESLPPVSVIIPTLNEAGYIRSSIDSLIGGDYPLDRLEILVVDGGSSDGTRAIVESMTAQHSLIKLIANPKRIVPAAMNLGLASATSDVIVWVGAHAVYSKNYLSRSVEVLLERQCASVGGVLRAVGKRPFSKAIAAATNSKFGIGNAKYRHAKELQSVDTVFGGCWLKSSVVRIGGFNEEWVRNQDFELNYRLRQMCGEIILDPSIKCDYFCRESLNKLASQYYQYGFWRFKTVLRHRDSFSARLAAPLLLMIGLAMSVLVAPICTFCAAVVPLVYLTALLGVSIVLSFTHRELHYLACLPLIFATLHLSWGAGFFMSIFKHVTRSFGQD